MRHRGEYGYEACSERTRTSEEDRRYSASLMGHLPHVRPWMVTVRLEQLAARPTLRIVRSGHQIPHEEDEVSKFTPGQEAWLKEASRIHRDLRQTMSEPPPPPAERQGSAWQMRQKWAHEKARADYDKLGLYPET